MEEHGARPLSDLTGGIHLHTIRCPDREVLRRVLAALDREGIQKAALVAYAQNQAGNRFWAAMGFTTREDLTYRNKAIHETARLSPGQPPHS